MLLLIFRAFADTYTDDFSADQGRWSGGAVADGVLQVQDGAATLDLGEVTALSGTLRVRSATGGAVTVALGDRAWEARYEDGGGISLGDERLPLPTGHYAWVPDPDPVIEPGAEVWDAGNTLHAEVFYDEASATWFLFWTGELPPPNYGYRQIGLATSPDGQTWTPYPKNPVLTVDYDRSTIDGIHVHMPTVVKDELGTWHMYYSCYQNDVGNRICHAISPDGYSWTPEGMALDKGGPGTFDEGSLRSPDVIVGPDGTWHMLYNGTDPVQHYGPTGYATSPDGWTWTKQGMVSADEYRLQGGSCFDGPYGVEQWWNCEDVFCHSTAQWDNFADWVDDPSGVILEKGWADWSDGYIQAPTVWLVDTTWHMWFNAYTYDGDAHERLGHAQSVPVPGEWLSLSITWDGSTLSVAQNGATQAVTATGVKSLVIGAEGAVEVDDLSLSWTVDSSAQDSGAQDSGAGPGDSDSGAAGTDSNKDAPASGCGCAGAPGSAAPLSAALALLVVRRARGRGPARGDSARGPSPGDVCRSRATH